MISTDLLYSLAFDAVQSQSIGLGKKRLKTLIDFFPDVQSAWEAPDAQILAIDDIPVNVREKFVIERKKISPEKTLEDLEKKKINAISLYDSSYPSSLLKLDSPPLVLYFKGEFSLDFLERSVAIVGTREPSEYGSKKIYEMAYQLASLGFTIVSGMARGIDCWAHKGSLSFPNSRNIAVLANGVDLIVPLSSWEVYNQLEKNGCILSEYIPGTNPEKGFFPARNRIIAALSKVVLVGEAGARSGALITADRAVELKLPVFGLAGSPGPHNEGILKWIRKGAAKLITSTDDLLEELNISEALSGVQQLDMGLLDVNFSSSEKKKVKAKVQKDPQNEHKTISISQVTSLISELNEEEKNIFEAIPVNQFISFDKLLEGSSSSVSKLNSVLMKLQMKKLVKRDPSGALTRN